MALAETLLRKVHKLGLVPKIIRALPKLLAILCLMSVAWLLFLPLEGNYRNVYVSENALMPSQVTSYFRESEWNHVRGYRSEIKKLDFNDVSHNNGLVAGWLNDVGLKSQYHSNAFGPDTLYTILHAPRGDNTEAMVLAIPWITSDQQHNIGGVSLGLAMARYFKKQSIWSKNIILVFPQNGHAALRSWVEAYHTSLDATAGSIEAAIVMEYAGDSDNFDYYEIVYEGLNGQLPNLDLINTATNIAYHENMLGSVQSTRGSELTKNTYVSRLRVLVSGIVNLALAGLTRHPAGCEAFSGWQIQAITIKAMGRSGGPDITQLGRVVDSTMRSVNNLLEKFHQSFFFYLLLSTKYFVSIGTYLPLAVLVAVAFAVSALGCLLSAGVSVEEYVQDIGKLLGIFTAIESVCFALAAGLPALVHLLPEELAVKATLVGLAAVVGTISIHPVVVEPAARLGRSLTHGLLALSLFVIALLVTTLLIVHFSLALGVGLLSFPLTLVQPLLSQPKSRKTAVRIALCLAVSNPIFIILVAGGAREGVFELFRGLLTSWHELQCWTWLVVLLGWLPSWIGVASAVILGTFVDEEKKNQ